MRVRKNYFNADTGSARLESSFLSCEKDAELIVKKLLVESRPYSDELKRLLLINTKDCLDDRTNPTYLEKIKSTSIADMVDQQYIRFQPNLTFGENEQVKSYIIISFDNFAPTDNPRYRDCVVEIDILSHFDAWDLGNYRLRPIKIAGYIDGILNNSRLTGLGTLEFVSCNELVLSEKLGGYCLMYRTVHGEDDLIEPSDE